jgi:hypothetical protein
MTAGSLDVVVPGRVVHAIELVCQGFFLVFLQRIGERAGVRLVVLAVVEFMVEQVIVLGLV